MDEPKLPAWCRLDAKLVGSAESKGLLKMIEGYERDARSLYNDYRELQSLRREFSGQEYLAYKGRLDSYKFALLAVRKLLRMLITAKAEPKKRASAKNAQRAAKAAA